MHKTTDSYYNYCMKFKSPTYGTIVNEDSNQLVNAILSNFYQDTYDHAKFINGRIIVSTCTCMHKAVFSLQRAEIDERRLGQFARNFIWACKWGRINYPSMPQTHDTIGKLRRILVLWGLLSNGPNDAQGRRLRFASGGIIMASAASLKIFCSRGG
jgi:hypothetical protein